MTTDGKIREFDDERIDTAQAITAGPDGALWFYSSRYLGRITTDGVFRFLKGAYVSYAFNAIAGPDGNLWYTIPYEDTIVRMTASGTITPFTASSGSSTRANLRIAKPGK